MIRSPAPSRTSPSTVVYAPRPSTTRRAAPPVCGGGSGAASPGRMTCSPANSVAVMAYVPPSPGLRRTSTRRSACSIGTRRGLEQRRADITPVPDVGLRGGDAFVGQERVQRGPQRRERERVGRRRSRRPAGSGSARGERRHGTSLDGVERARRSYHHDGERRRYRLHLGRREAPRLSRRSARAPAPAHGASASARARDVGPPRRAGRGPPPARQLSRRTPGAQELRAASVRSSRACRRRGPPRRQEAQAQGAIRGRLATAAVGAVDGHAVRGQA